MWNTCVFIPGSEVKDLGCILRYKDIIAQQMISHWTGDLPVHWQYSPLANTFAQDLASDDFLGHLPYLLLSPTAFPGLQHLIHPFIAEAKHSLYFIMQAPFSLSNFKLILDKLQMQRQWWLTKMFLLNKAVVPWGIVTCFWVTCPPNHIQVL